MAQAQAGCVQGLAREVVEQPTLPGRRTVRFARVERVADERVTDAREVYADLMGAAGVRRRQDECGHRQLPEAFDHPETGARLATLADPRLHAMARDRVAPDREVDLALVIARGAAHDREVGLVDGASLELRADRVVRLRVERARDAAAGLPVEKITAELVNALRFELTRKKIITDKNILTKEATEKIKEISFAHLTLAEHAIHIKEQFVAAMQQKGSRKLKIENGDNEPITNDLCKYVTETEFKKILDRLTEH